MSAVHNHDEVSAMPAEAHVHLAASSKHHGIALWPPPSTDPKDPLRWPRWVKIVALIATCLANFTSNFAGAGFSVATPVLERQFQESAVRVNYLLTFNFLLLGLGNLFWVPLASKFGKRASLIGSMLLQFGALIWQARASTYASLLGARCVQGFAAAAGESIVPGIVADIFFLHERAFMMSIYVILTSGSTAIGPLIAGFVVAKSAGTWRTFTWVCVALAGANAAMMWLAYPESNYRRPAHYEVAERGRTEDPTIEKEAGSLHLESTAVVTDGVQHVDHVNIDWMKVRTSLITYDRELGFFQALARPFTFLVYPHVLWAVFVYGTALGSQIILIFAFPSLLLAPPYLWASTNVGVIQVAAIIAFAIACFCGGWLADVITTRMIVRAGYSFVPEQRLVALLPACWIAPIGCIIIAFSCAQKLSWVAIAFGFGMVSFGTVYAPNIAITYIVESHPEFSSDCLVVINVFKNLVAFVLAFEAVGWVQSQGWVQVYMILFMLVMLSMLLAIPVYLFGERLRRWSEKLVTPAGRHG